MHLKKAPLKQLFLRALLTSLSLNLCLASIPRCDLLVNIFFQTWLTPEDSAPKVSCHGPQEGGIRPQVVIKGDSGCRCKLLEYLIATLPVLSSKALADPVSREAGAVVSSYYFWASDVAQEPVQPPPRVFV